MPCDILLVRHDFNCGYTYKNKAYAHILDSLADVLAKNSIKCRALALPFSYLVEDRAHYSPIAINRLYLKNIFLYLLNRLFMPKAKARNKHMARSIESWLRLLQKTNPKIVLIINMDNFLAYACKLQNIPLYEVQHGVISENHDIPLNLVECSSKNLPLPSGFLCWDEESALVLRNLQLDYYDIRVIGNPWLLRHLQDNEDPLVQEANDKLKKIFFLNNGKPNILVTLQWGLKDFYGIKNDVMTDSLKNAIIRTQGTYNWLIRLHPITLRGHQKSKVINFLNDNFSGTINTDWKITSEASLPALLTKTNLHITYSSSTVIEAAYLGIDSAILSPYITNGGFWSDCFEKERRIGLAEVIPDSEQKIIQWIIQKKSHTRHSEKSKTEKQYPEIFLDFLREKISHYSGTQSKV